jgi:hypothetical protein
MSDTVRIWSTISVEANERLEEMSRRFGIAKTALIALALQAGMNAIERSIQPERVITEQMWKEIIRAGKSLDMDIKREGGE